MSRAKNLRAGIPITCCDAYLKLSPYSLPTSRASRHVVGVVRRHAKMVSEWACNIEA